MKEQTITVTIKGGPARRAVAKAGHDNASALAAHAQARRRCRIKAALIAAKYTALTAAGVALYLWARGYANTQRGYEAVGGEVFLLALPLVWLMVEITIRDAINLFRELWKEAADNED